MVNETSNRPVEERKIVLTPEQDRRRRARNVAIALALTAFMALFYIVTIVKLGGGAPRPPV